jgi:hypothetical protein
MDREERDLTWKIGCAVALLSAVAVFCGIKDELAAQDAAEEASQRISEATASATTATERAAELARRMVPRKLTSEQIASLTEALRDVPGPKLVRMSHPVSDPEAASFAAQFTAAFRNAGWEVRRSAVIDGGEIRTGGGLFFDPKAGYEQVVEGVLAAFATAGCATKAYPGVHEEAPVTLRIFSKG